jgi:1,4-dihydroxy-2-naphthoate octaprenyltransferase
MLLGTYPMTQIYQHEEDAKRGDVTLSLRLGLRGTFLFVLITFVVATTAYLLYFHFYFSDYYGIAFTTALSPVVIFFLYWFYKVSRKPEAANYSRTMWLNFLSATCLNAFFYLVLSGIHELAATLKNISMRLFHQPTRYWFYSTH